MKLDIKKVGTKLGHYNKYNFLHTPMGLWYISKFEIEDSTTNFNILGSSISHKSSILRIWIKTKNIANLLVNIGRVQINIYSNYYHYKCCDCSVMSFSPEQINFYTPFIEKIYL